jgi:hypothetical protein
MSAAPESLTTEEKLTERLTERFDDASSTVVLATSVAFFLRGEPP